jgi:type II secretory pathway pseudopilin PulG
MRSLAVGLLTLSVVGGYQLGIDRQTQHRSAALVDAQLDNHDDLYQHKRDYAASAAQRAAQAAAKAQADAAAAAAAAAAKAADDAARKQQAASRGANRPPATPGVPVPTSCSQFTGNQATACAILPEFGFGIDQMKCLVPLWMKESHWNERDRNPSSGAYGIPQALPPTKMAKYGADYLTNAVPQIRWGLSYIKGRYTSPCGGWSFWQGHGWY